MTEQRRAMNPRAIEWLRQGPDAAPDGLLQASLARAGRTRQRPWLLAMAAAGRAATGSSARVERRMVLLAAAALASLLVGLWIVGSTRERDSLVVVIPPSDAADRPTPAPSRPAVVFPTTPPDPPEPNQIQLFDQHLQLLIDASGTYTATASEAAIAWEGMTITVERWPVGAGFRLEHAPGGIVRGSNLGDIASSVEALLDATGISYRRSNRTLDYHAAIEWVSTQPLATDGPPFHVTLVIDDAAAYLIVASVFQPELDGIVLARYARLQSSIDFLVPTDVTVLGGRVSLWLPGDMHVGDSTDGVAVIEPNGRLLGLPRDIVVQRVRLGSEPAVVLDGHTDGFRPVVDGDTLDEVAESLQRTSGGRLRRGNRAGLSLDGHAGYHWRYAVDSELSDLFGPLYVDIGLVIVGGDAYVILGVDDDLFRSIRFLT